MKYFWKVLAFITGSLVVIAAGIALALLLVKHVITFFSFMK